MTPFDPSALLIAIDLVEAGGMPDEAEWLRSLVNREAGRQKNRALFATSGTVSWTFTPTHIQVPHGAIGRLIEADRTGRFQQAAHEPPGALPGPPTEGEAPGLSPLRTTLADHLRPRLAGGAYVAGKSRRVRQATRKP